MFVCVLKATAGRCRPYHLLSLCTAAFNQMESEQTVFRQRFEMGWSESASRLSAQISISSPWVALCLSAAGGKIFCYILPLVITACTKGSESCSIRLRVVQCSLTWSASDHEQKNEMTVVRWSLTCLEARTPARFSHCELTGCRVHGSQCGGEK